MWLRKLYLQLYNESEHDEFRKPIGPRPVEALQAFGGRVEKWKNLGKYIKNRLSFICFINFI